MWLKRVQMSGIGPFREVDIDFEQLPTVLAVTGPNGAGKSSFLEAAFGGALFRRTPSRGSLIDMARGGRAQLTSEIVNGAPWTLTHEIDGAGRSASATILDADGRSCLADAKVSKFDEFVASHFLARELFYQSFFAHQKSAGFMGLSEGERKGVFLRMLGVDHLELLAKLARDEASEAQRRLGTVKTRLRDELDRSDDVDRARAALAAGETEAEGAAAAAAHAEAAVTAARARREAAIAANRGAAERGSKRDQLGREIARLQGERTDTAARLEKQRALLGDAEAVRAAVDALPALDDEIAAARAAGAQLLARLEAARLARGAADEVVRSRDAARRRVVADRDQVVKERTPAIVAAAAEPEDLEAERHRAKALDEADAQRRFLRDQRQLFETGAEQRIELLRETLRAIAAGDLGPADQVARDAIAEDDVLAASIPTVEALEQAQKELAARESVVVAAERRVRRAEEVGRAKVAIAQLDARLERAEAALAEADGEIAEAKRDAGEAAADVGRLEREIGAAGDPLRALEQRRAELGALAKRADDVAAARERIATLEERARALDEAIAVAERDRAAIPAGGEVPVPEIAAEEDDHAEARKAAQAAEGAVAVLRARLTSAEAAAGRIAAFRASIAAETEDLGDWQRIAQDLGRDGLQAVLIDAAGPETAAIANELLEACAGGRWAVTIDARRMSADGKKELDGCEALVADAESGYYGAAEALSGGEGVVVNEAIALALVVRQIQRVGGGVGCTIVRDESGAALDPENAERYVRMLRRAAEMVHARQVLFVSHQPNMADLADARLIVGGGRVEVRL